MNLDALANAVKSIANTPNKPRVSIIEKLANEPRLPPETLAAIHRQREEERAKFAPDTIPAEPLFTWQGVGRFLDQDPPPRKWVFENCLPSGVVGAIFATGGTGKTFMALHMAAAAASGVPFGPFRPSKPMRVLFLSGEDDVETMWGRIRDVAREMGLAGSNDLRNNLELVSLVGTDRVLIALGENNNPRTTSVYRRLDESIKMIGGVDLLFIDTMSRFFGLSENDNAHGAAWVSCLEELNANNPGMTSIFLHHEAKNQVKDGNVTTSGGRGASSIRDNARWALSLAAMDEGTAKRMDVVASQHVACFMTKSNHSEGWQNIEYFRRGPGGTLSPAFLPSDRLNAQVDLFVELLGKQKDPVTKRDLDRGYNGGKKIDEALKKVWPNFRRYQDMPAIITTALAAGRIVSTPIGKGASAGEAFLVDQVDDVARGDVASRGKKPSATSEQAIQAVLDVANEDVAKVPLPRPPLPRGNTDPEPVNEGKNSRGRRGPLKGECSSCHVEHPPAGDGVARHCSKK